jgi:hypothetical protein
MNMKGLKMDQEENDYLMQDYLIQQRIRVMYKAFEVFCENNAESMMNPLKVKIVNNILRYAHDFYGSEFNPVKSRKTVDQEMSYSDLYIFLGEYVAFFDCMKMNLQLNQLQEVSQLKTMMDLHDGKPVKLKTQRG